MGPVGSFRGRGDESVSMSGGRREEGPIGRRELIGLDDRRRV
jgi:hypothetical protein